MNQESQNGTKTADSLNPNPEQQAFLKELVEYAIPFFKHYNDSKTALQRQSSDNESVIAKQELDMLNRIDKRDKIYKALIIALCLIALIIVAFIDKLQGISPIIGVIIGLVLKSNSISEYFSASRNTNTDGDA